MGGAVFGSCTVAIRCILYQCQPRYECKARKSWSGPNTSTNINIDRRKSTPTSLYYSLQRYRASHSWGCTNCHCGPSDCNWYNIFQHVKAQFGYGGMQNVLQCKSGCGKIPMHHDLSMALHNTVFSPHGDKGPAHLPLVRSYGSRLRLGTWSLQQWL